MNPKDIPTPHIKRLNPQNPFYDEIILRHKEACVLEKDFYIDPQTGLKVFTAYYHLERGNCCGSGCRHCPYII